MTLGRTKVYACVLRSAHMHLYEEPSLSPTPSFQQSARYAQVCGPTYILRAAMLQAVGLCGRIHPARYLDSSTDTTATKDGGEGWSISRGRRVAGGDKKYSS